MSITGHLDALRRQQSGVVEIPFGPVNAAQTTQGINDAVWMIEHLGDPNPLVGYAHPLVELAALGEGQRPEETGHGGGESREAAPFAKTVAREQLKDFYKELVDAAVVARDEVGGAKVVVRGDPEGQILDPLADAERTLGERGCVRRKPG